MSHKTRHEKRSSARKLSTARSKRTVFRKLDRRVTTASCLLLFALAVGITYARLPPAAPYESNAESKPTVINKDSANPVKNVLTMSDAELANIPPEALHPHPLEPAGYNATSGGLPPDALPPGVVLPGITDSGRTMAQGYGVYDGVRQQFTGKERDTETGLDYFGARYYSSVQGRFTSPDSRNIIFEKDRGKTSDKRSRILNEFLSNPQNWNQYSYVRNNPLAYRDPNGKCSAPAGLSKGNVGICIEAFIAAPSALVFKGDNRDFAANDPSKHFRVQVQGIFTQGNFGWQAKLHTTPGITDTRISILGLPGEVKSNITSKRIDAEGNFHISLQITGLNGYSAATGVAESEKIRINLNLVVTPNGKVGVEKGSESTNYPSIALYSYNIGPDGKPMANVIFEYRETKPSALSQPLVDIQAFKPSRCPESPGCVKQ